MSTESSRRALLVIGLAAAGALVGCSNALRAASPVTDPSSAATHSPASSRGTKPLDTTPSNAEGSLGSAGVPPSPTISPAASTRPTRSAPSAMTQSATPASRGTATTTARRSTSGSPTRRPAGPAAQIAHGPRTRPQVALTFHGAGDIGYARQILRIANEKRARITVMVVGTWLVDNPSIGKEILGGGHELGNHTLSHLDINSLPEAQMRSEVIGCRDLLLKTTGDPGAYFRQSQSKTANALVRRVAAEAGYAVCLSYDLDSMDWTDPGASAVRQNTAAALPGAIVSMHLGHSDTVAALPGVLEDLAGRGLSAVTVSTLLSR